MSNKRVDSKAVPGGTLMSRRAALLASSGLVAAGMTRLAAGASSKAATSNSSPDVIVIGGGFAGVTAARDLAQRGLHVTLLEARNRLGGRTFTTKFGQDEIELGGTWIHWTQPYIWIEMMRYGLGISDTWTTPTDRTLWFADGKVNEKSAEDYGVELAANFKRYFKDCEKVISLPYVTDLARSAIQYDHLSAEDRLNQIDFSAQERGLMSPILSMYFLGSAKEGAYTELVRDWTLAGRDMGVLAEAASRYSIQGGTAALIDRMVQDGGFEVRLSSAVSQVIQTPTGVTVKTEDGKALHSRFVVVAVPVNTLNSIDFQPKLIEGKRAMASERHPGVGCQVYIRVKGPFTTTIYAPPSEGLSCVSPWKIDASGGTLLKGYSCNAGVPGFDPHSAKSVQAFLSRYVPGTEVTETLGYDWVLDPYALGTHCFFKPNQWSRYLSALRQPEGRLFFAGGDIASGWRGYIDGAIESGALTAQVVIAAARASAAPSRVVRGPA